MPLFISSDSRPEVKALVGGTFILITEIIQSVKLFHTFLNFVPCFKRAAELNVTHPESQSLCPCTSSDSCNSFSDTPWLQVLKWWIKH